MVAVLPAHAEDRHDVGVVQPRRRLRLALEPPHLLRVQQRAGREDLQRHAAAQRLLLGLVDHAHAAPADLAEDAVVAQPLEPDPHRGAVGGQRAGGAAGALAQVLHHQQGREQVADLVGQLGVALEVLAERGLLAAALAVEELLGQELDGVALVAGGIHRRASPAGPWGDPIGATRLRSAAHCRHRAPAARLRTRSMLERTSYKLLSQSRDRRQDLLEPLQRPDVTVAGRRLGQAEHLRGLVVGEVLEMPQGQDLAVDRVHAVERLLDDQLVLGPDRGLAGAGHLAQELGGQRDRVACGNGPRWSETSWPASRIWAPRWWRCTSVSRWPVDQPEPEVERHGRGVAGVLGNPLADVEIGLLEHVGRIDPAGEPAVEPQADHPPQPVAIAVEERGQRRLVAGHGALDKDPGRRRPPDRTSFGLPE